MFTTPQAKLERCARLAETRGRQLAVSLLNRTEDAEDVLQQSLLIAARKADEIPLFSLWPWLAKVITFEAKNHIRNGRTRDAATRRMQEGLSGRTTGEVQDPRSSKQDNPLEIAIADELRNQLASALAGLECHQREALALVYGGGLSVREAAKIAGIPRRTFRRNLDLALTNLRSRLGVAKHVVIGALGGWWADVAASAGGTSGPAVSVDLTPASTGGAGVGGGAGVATATATIVYGGVIMTTKQVLAVGAIIAVATAGVWWGLSGGDEADGRKSYRPVSIQPATVPVEERDGETLGIAGRKEPVGADASETPKSSPMADERPSEQLVEGGAISTDGEFIEDRLWNRGISADVEYASDTPFAVTVDGRVVSVAGAPLAGAVVSGHRATISHEFRYNDEERRGDIRKDYGPWLITDGGQTVSGADGSFRLTITGMGPAPRVSGHGPLAHLRTKLEGWQMVTVPGIQWTDDARDIAANITLEMTQAASVRGHAVDAMTGLPVAGAVVGASYLGRLSGTATRGSSPWGDINGQNPAIVTAGEDGAFELKGVGEGNWRIYALPPGISPSKYRGVADDLPTEDLGAVRIEAKGGQDTNGMVVRVTRVPNLYFRTDPTDLTRLRVAFQRKSDTSPTLGALSPFELLSGGATRRVVRIEDGRWMVRGIAAKHERVVVGAAGKAPLDMDMPSFTGEDVDLGLLWLQEGCRLEILVLDGMGSPARQAYVTVGAGIDQSWRRGQVDFMTGEQSVTGMDGRVTATGLLAGEYEVSARLANHAEGKARILVQEAGTNEITISLARELSIRGRVIPPDGAPPPTEKTHSRGQRTSSLQLQYCPEALVRLHNSQSIIYHGSRHVSSMPGSQGGPAFVMSDWTFEIRGLVAGKYFVGVSMHGMSLMVLAEASERSDAETVLDLSGVGTVHGVVTGPHGKPLANAKVMAFVPGTASRHPSLGPPQLPMATAATDSAGRYQFEGLPARDIEFRVDGYRQYHPDGTTDKRMVVEVEKGGSREFNIDLSQFAGVELRARWRFAGTDAPVFSQMFLDPKDGAKVGNYSRSNGMFRDHDCWFRTSGLSAGRYQASLIGASENSLRHSLRMEFNIPEGAKEHVIDEILVAGDLSGTIASSQTGLTPPPVKIDFKRLIDAGAVDASGWTSHITVSAGAYDIRHIIAGKYRVTLTAPGHMDVTRDVDIGPGTREDFDLGEPAGSVVLRNVRLVDGAGNVVPPVKPYQSVWVHVYDRSGKAIPARKSGNIGSPNGFGMPGSEATLDAIPPGDVRIILTSDQFQVWEHYVRIEAGEPHKVDVTLVPAPRLILRFDPDGLNTAEQRKTIRASVKWQGPKGVAGWTGGPASGNSTFDGMVTMTGSTQKLGTTEPVTFYPVSIGRAGPVEITVTRPGFRDHVAAITMDAGDAVVHDIVWVKEE